ncbi:hypothetical protein ABIB95_004956 [Bradyrhizobium sp. LA2.1]
MLPVLANRTYRHLFAAQVIALVGTRLMTVALGLLAFKIAGDKAGACWARRLRSRWSPMSALHRSREARSATCRAGPDVRLQFLVNWISRTVKVNLVEKITLNCNV